MSRIVFDPKRPDIDETSFAPITTDWKDFYGDVEEELPPRMPEPLEAEYGGEFYFWFGVCRVKGSKGLDCFAALQVEDVWSTVGRTDRCDV